MQGNSLCACRWDSECCENEKWKASADVLSLKNGEKQPFYHVLVDLRDWPADSSDVPVAYVAHEKLYAPEVCSPVSALPASRQLLATIVDAIPVYAKPSCCNAYFPLRCSSCI